MLEIKNITKIFNREEPIENQKIALDHINITIEDGEFVTIIGGNGSGKTTLMNLICGVFEPDEGQIILDGFDITRMSEAKRAVLLGRVFQDPRMGTAPNMSINENLEIASRRGVKGTLRWGFRKENYDIFVEKLTKLNLGIEEHMNQKVGLLSGGQRQAITLIMATLKKPKLLLLDEHTAALDPKTAKKVLELTTDIVNETKVTTLMITHNMRDALKYGNRLLMFSNGRLVLDVKDQAKEQLTIEDLLKKFEVFEEENIS